MPRDYVVQEEDHEIEREEEEELVAVDDQGPLFHDQVPVSEEDDQERDEEERQQDLEGDVHVGMLGRKVQTGLGLGQDCRDQHCRAEQNEDHQTWD